MGNITQNMKWTGKFGPKNESPWDAFSRMYHAGIFDEDIQKIQQHKGES